MPAAVHALTPTIAVHDPRGLPVRELNYCRVQAGDAAERRVQAYRHDAAGHLVASRDPRLWALHEQDGTTPANLLQVYSLSGRELCRDSVDAGFACNLFGEAGQPLRFEDGNGNRREMEYDSQLRPLALHESSGCAERYTYAGTQAEHAVNNACGRLLRHDDTAGSRSFEGYALVGEISRETRRFSLSSDWPDWPEPVDERDALLEPEAALNTWRHGPLGDVLEQTDAAGNRQVLGLTLAGELRAIRVQINQGTEQSVLGNVRYNAFGQREEEQLGNGVLLQREYRAEDGRLLRLGARRANGEALQDLHYGYDPAGNVIFLEDLARPLRHFANQRIQPRCEYVHDSLYQLREATGWEAGAASRGPGSLLDPAAVSNYRQQYAYDAGGNLLELTHVGAQAHGRTLVAERHSNRCLAPGEEFVGSFDANGNPLHLQPGQGLLWNPRNGLHEVSPVSREDGADDSERYVYDGAGQRVRKLATARAANRTHSRETRYLPGLERHSNSATGEAFEVMTVQAGSSVVRVLHWQAGRPAEVPQDQLRYALGDHLGSSSLELDGDAALISHEVFHPFGSTAWWAARNEIEAGYKTLRYSGKERDATGLYYYGARYYRADWQRWLNPDPAGTVDGLNLYCMVANGPVNRRDPDGMQGFDVMDDAEMLLVNSGDTILFSGLENFPQDVRDNIHESARLARKWVKKTVSAASGGKRPKRLEKIMTAAFGSDNVLARPKLNRLKANLSSELQRGSAFLKDLLANGGSKLSLIKFHEPHMEGVSVDSVVHGARIALSESAASGDVMDLAATLLHESLHAMGMQAGVPDTEETINDYWYAVPKRRARTGAQIKALMYHRFDAMVRTGPDEGQMSAPDQHWYARLINKETDRRRLPRANGEAQRASYFKNYPFIRRAAGMRNADTLTGIAMAFHRFDRM